MANPKKEVYFDIVIPKELLDLQNKSIPSPDQINEWQDLLERNLFINSVIDDNIIDYAGYHIRKWNKEDNEKGLPVEERVPIKLFIHTDGGAIIPTLHIIDLIKLSKTPVYTIAQDRAYSSGGYILMVGHKRFCYPNTTCLVHDGSTGCFGDTSKVLDNIKFQEKLENEVIKKLVIDNTKITNKEYKEHYREDWFMTSDEMLKYGIVDEILTEIM